VKVAFTGVEICDDNVEWLLIFNCTVHLIVFDFSICEVQISVYLLLFYCPHCNVYLYSALGFDR